MVQPLPTIEGGFFPDALALGAAWGFEFKTCAFTLKPSVAVAWWGGRGVR